MGLIQAAADYIIIIIIKIESAVQGRERMRTLYQSEDPNPRKEEKEKIVGDKKKERISPTGKHWLCS